MSETLTPEQKVAVREWALEQYVNSVQFLKDCGRIVQRRDSHGKFTKGYQLK